MNLIKPLLGKAFRLLSLIFLVSALLPVLYLLEPLYRVRLGTMYTQRFGHLAINTETFLRELQLGGIPKRTLYLFFGWDPANRQLMEMWKRTKEYPVRFIESKWGTRVMFAWRPVLVKTRFWEESSVTATEYYLFNHTRPVLSFTEEEERKGREKIAEMGISENDWFVCFHARDVKYFRQWRPELEDRWQMADFRNIDVMRFIKAAEFITTKGGFAIRYGANVERPLPETGNTRIIDYALKFRSDFMDVYLGQKCRFFIGACSGPIAIPSIFNVPVLSVNHFPYNYSYYRQSDIILPRLLSKKGHTDPVSFWEAQKAGYFVVGKDGQASSLHATSDLFQPLDMDEDDILDGCKDMFDALEGNKPPTQAKRLQDIYADQYFSSSPGYEFAARIGARYALKYRHFIEPPVEASVDTPADA